jgi:glycerol-3-phosphate dehydrogenase
LVVGGGVVGAGIALDAAKRGLTVGLVEAQDFASGTSSRSTKLIHGGLRYLQMFDFYLVHEALKERSLLSELIAPHLVTKIPFLYPLRHRVYERAYTSAGIALYDALGWSNRNARGVLRQRQVSRQLLYLESPGLRAGAFIGGIEYFDAQVDDARFVITLLRTAVSFGAVALNRTAAIGVVRDGDKVIGAQLRDLETGTEFFARAHSIIFATGVWTQEAAGLSGKEKALVIRPSKGVHLVVARGKIALSSAIVTKTEKSVLFVIPWGRHWIIGTTDTPWAYDKQRPIANASDIDYLLDHVNTILAKPLTKDDVESVTAGLRPLIAGAGEETTKVSREHAVSTPSPGLVAISGGKYTTYRIMAKDAVDAAVRDWPSPVERSSTESTPLLGASAIDAFQRKRSELVARTGLSFASIDHLIGRYGTLLEEVLEPAASDRLLLQPLTGGPGYLRAEVLYGVTHEGALHVEDILRRRLRLDWETPDRGTKSLEEVISIMGDALNWSESTKREESEKYLALVETELEAQSKPDDGAASTVMGAYREPSWEEKITP